MILKNIQNYLTRIYEKVFARKEKEQRYSAKIKNKWHEFRDYLSEFNYFSLKNPMTNEDKENFTKSLGEKITSNFDVCYNSFGMILTPKKSSKLEGFVCN